MGAVYEVIHLETTRRRALKVMLPHIIENKELRERFKLEARAAAHIEPFRGLLDPAIPWTFNVRLASR
jgi:hypothetical protein